MRLLLDNFFEKIKPLLEAYKEAYPTPHQINQGLWRMLVAPSQLIKNYERAIDDYFLWEELLKQQVIMQKKGFKTHFYLGDIKTLTNPLDSAKQLLSQLDTPIFYGYNPFNESINLDAKAFFRLGEIKNEQSLMILADRLHVFLQSLQSQSDYASMRQLIDLNIQTFNEICNEPPPQTDLVKFSAHAILSMDDVNLDDYLSFFQKKCINPPVIGRTPTAKIAQKDTYIVSLASHVYEFYHQFSDISASLDFTGAEFLFLNKRQKNIHYWLDTLKALQINFPTYDTPYSIAIVIWPHSVFESKIYISGMDSTHIVLTQALQNLHKTDLYGVIKGSADNDKDKENFLEACANYKDFIHSGQYELSDLAGVVVKNTVGRTIKM